MSKIKIQFDNGGGITIQVTAKTWSHHYDAGRAAQAAEDACALIDGANPGDWEGNDWGVGVRVDAHPACPSGDARSVRDLIRVSNQDSGHAALEFRAVVAAINDATDWYNNASADERVPVNASALQPDEPFINAVGIDELDRRYSGKASWDAVADDFCAAYNKAWHKQWAALIK